MILLIWIFKDILIDGWVRKKCIPKNTTLNIVFMVTNSNCLGQYELYFFG